MPQLRSVLPFALLITIGHTAFGDIAPGRSHLPKPPMVSPVRIEQAKLDDLGPNVAAKIVIPSSLLPDLQEPSYGHQASHKDSVAKTIVAGLILTAAAISLMFVKSNSQRWKNTAVGVIVCAVLIGGVVLANLFFSPNAPSTPDGSKPQQLIVIEIQNDGHEVTLVLPNHYNGLE